MGRAARSFVVERYSFSQIGGRLCNLFESTVKGARTAGSFRSRQLDFDVGGQ
jgi:hypothetical protein